MSSTSPWRMRTRQTADVSSLVRVGTLYKKNATTHAIVQTIPVNNGTWPFTFQEVTWDQTHVGPPYRSGGPFASVKAKVELGVQGIGIRKSIPSGGFYWEYNGGFARPFLSYETPRLNSMKGLAVEDPYGDGVLVSEGALGSEAYDRLRPRLNHADSSVFLYELKDTSRMLQTSAAFFKNVYRNYAPRGSYTSSYVTSGEWLTNYYNALRRQGVIKPGKKGADHYLNHNFGWVPFINDLLKIAETVKHQRMYIRQITKDNGSWIRRVRKISSSQSESITHSGYSQGIAWKPEFDLMSSDMSPGTYSRYRLEQRNITVSNIWAAGSFTYYRPEFDASLSDYESNWNEAIRVLTLYGARINPYVLWKITPWTWLIDWFLGIGTLIDRAVSWSTDGVVSRYMYLMKHTTDVVSHTVTANWNSGPVTMHWNNSIDSKQREVADNNFSFRLSGSLSARQLAIIAALGLSRVRT